MVKIRCYISDSSVSKKEDAPVRIEFYNHQTWLCFPGGQKSLDFDPQNGFFLLIDTESNVLFGKKLLIITDLIGKEHVTLVTCKFSINEKEAPITNNGEYLLKNKVVVVSRKENFPQNNLVKYFLSASSIDEFNEVIQAFWSGKLTCKETDKTLLEVSTQNLLEALQKLEKVNASIADLRAKIDQLESTLCSKIRRFFKKFLQKVGM